MRPAKEIGCKVVNRAVPGMFYLADVLEFVVDSSLDDRPFPEEDFVIEIHQQFFMFLFSFVTSNT